eukprot:scaffold947_cov375-Prasinococcus_capsulatus_cf.AAC.10
MMTVPQNSNRSMPHALRQTLATRNVKTLQGVPSVITLELTYASGFGLQFVGEEGAAKCMMPTQAGDGKFPVGGNQCPWAEEVKWSVSKRRKLRNISSWLACDLVGAGLFQPSVATH